MTDANPTPPPSEPVNPVTPPAAPAAPAYAATPTGVAPKQTLSLVSFILGLVAFVFGWLWLVGLGAGIAAIIVSRRAKKNEPGAPAWMPLIGLIAGIIGAVVGAIFLILFFVGLALSATLGTYGN